LQNYVEDEKNNVVSEKKQLFVRPKPRKKLTDEAKELTANFDETRFGTYSRRILGCFSNIDLVPEIDLDEALASLAIICDGKSQVRFYASPLFESLAKQALDFSKEIPTKIRKALVLVLLLCYRLIRLFWHLRTDTIENT
jgi:hypothetical protein